MSEADKDGRIRELEARVAQLEAHRAPDSLRLQSSTAVELLKTLDRAAVFELVTEKIYSIAGGAIVAISEFDPRACKVTVRSLGCTPEEHRLATAILGADPVGLCLDLADETRRRWKVSELARVPGGVYELLFRQVPATICERLEREMGLRDVFGMACAHEDDILGSVALVTHGRGPLRNRKLVEALVALAALALKRIRAEESRKETEERFRLLFDSTSDGVWIHTLDGVIREVNDAYCAMSGYARAELQGMPIGTLEAVETPVDIADHMAKVIERGGHDRFESKHRRKDGSIFAVDITALYLQRDGRMAIFVRDITERKQAEESLREAARRKDEFIAILSHELRNPLAPIRYAVPLLQREQLAESGVRALAVIDRQLGHLTRLVDDLLDVSRIATGKIELRRDHVTLGAVVTAAIEGASPAVAAGHHTLKVAVPEEPVWLYADAARLAQVVANLLDNSAKYTPHGGRIELEAGQEDDHAFIRVHDSGVGISAEVLPSVFEMFHQGNTPFVSHKSEGGLGIGLALARRLIEMHDGAISAHSAGVGQGAEFVVRLPLARPAAPSAMPAMMCTTTGRRSLKVLVVDDNADLVDMLAALISGLGHDVRKALDGRSAVSAALSYRPDVVLLDLGLPGMSGIEVARSLRQHPETVDARLVALTGWGQAGDRRETAEAGFDYHLTKPTDPDTLERLLAKFAAEVTI